MPEAPVEQVEVGRLNGLWGLGGWIKVFSYTDPPEAIFDYLPWNAHSESGAEAELQVEAWRRVGPRLIARLAGIETPDAARRLGRPVLRVPRSRLPEPPAGHHYWTDLLGLVVANLEGRELGRVRGLVETGAHDVLAVDTGRDQADDILIPFVPGRFVHAVDLASGRILVDWDPDWAHAD